MNKFDIKKQKEVLFFDGGFGSLLIEKNIQYKHLSETLNIENSRAIIDIHKEYIIAGSNFITTNTFSANSIKLKETGYSVEEIVTSAIENAKIAVKECNKDNVYVVQSISSAGKLLYPNGDLTFDEAYECFKEQVIAGVNAGTDIFLLETFMDLNEMRAGVLAIKENSNLPVFATMTFEENRKTLTGTDPKTFVNVIQNLGVDVLGVNCSLGADMMYEIVEEICDYASIPVMIQPNRGIPKIVNGKTTYDVTVEDFCNDMYKLAKFGVNIVGGCCGTNPQFIKELVDNKDKFDFYTPTKKTRTLVSSQTKTIDLRTDINMIGERLNPTGKKVLQESLKNKNYDFVAREAIKQVECGATILDINGVVASLDEKDTLFNMMNAVIEVVDVPLQFDSTKFEVIEKCLRYYGGRAIVNSINAKQSNLDALLPIIKKYGALAIGLTIDEKGIPKTKDERLEIADSIITSWNNFGLDEHDLIIDALTLTVSAQQEDAFSTVTCIRELKEKYCVLTALGVSNISFGLPNRKIINRTFLAFALSNGLDLPIVDPFDENIRETVACSRIILNIDKDSQDYINSYKNIKAEPKSSTNEIDLTLSEIVYKGLRNSARDKTVSLLNEGICANDIINNELITTLNDIGEKFSKSELFLPDLIRSSETVKISFEVLKENILNSGEIVESKGKIILATVKGDVHDIGKNIVKTVLENYGFEILDLGKDVSPNAVIDAIIEHDIKLVGLSALMTTTVESMKETIDLIKEKNLDCKVMVGGAVLNKDFAKEIGADFYGKDANESVAIANKFFNTK